MGNIIICINGTYVAICDLGWDDVEAQLACNSVGYSEPFFRKLWIYYTELLCYSYQTYCFLTLQVALLLVDWVLLPQLVLRM